ncbi:MAG: helix-turn-helix domain-containing protein [Pseudonocardiaceae bacterium]
MAEDGRAFGRRVAVRRKQLGYSQAQFARVLDRSVAWLSQVERGVRRIDRMSVLNRLAAALEMPLTELTPERTAVESEPVTSVLSLALSASDALGAALSSTRPVEVDSLRARSECAREHAEGSRDDEAAGLLVELLPDLEHAQRHTGGAQQRRVCVVKARTYHTAAAVLSKLGDTAAAWVAMDRAVQAAAQADDPLLMAEGAFRLSLLFQGARRFDLSMRAATSAAAAIAELSAQGTPEAVALHGALHLQAAVAAAALNNAAQAYDELTIAQHDADLLGADRDDHGTGFGPTDVLLHEIAVAVELGDAGRALRTAERIDPSGMSPQRHGRLLIDVARAHAQLRQTEAVVSSLRHAIQVAPEQVRSHAQVRDLVGELLRGDASADIQELAARIHPE